MNHQSTIYGIGVHVVEFFFYLLHCVDIEIAKTVLPESRKLIPKFLHSGRNQMFFGVRHSTSKISRDSLF